MGQTLNKSMPARSLFLLIWKEVRRAALTGSPGWSSGLPFMRSSVVTFGEMSPSELTANTPQGAGEDSLLVKGLCD